MVSHDATNPSNHSLFARYSTRLVATNCGDVCLGAEYGPYDDAVTNNCPRIGGTRIQGADLSVYSLGLIGSAPIGAIVLGNIIEIFGTLEALIPAMLVSVVLFIYGVFFSPVWSYLSPTFDHAGKIKQN